MSVDELRIRKLLKKYDRMQGGETRVPPSALRVNVCELAFVKKAITRGKATRILRAGWPDFLIIEDGKCYGVEVKNEGDFIRASQREMFLALESIGIKVFLWMPSKPDVLQHWSKGEKPKCSGYRPPQPRPETRQKMRRIAERAAAKAAAQ